MSRQLNLNAFLMSTGHHEASWRLPESDPHAAAEVTHYQRLARIAERGTMDSVFFADSPSMFSNPARRPPETLEPTLLLAAMAVVTKRIGLIATASTTYEEPYSLARRFASLDAISHGRAGWNVVTTAALDAGANFGYEANPTHAARYARAGEFVEVVLGLWDGWDDDAVVADKAKGVHTDPRRVHRLEHRGPHFSVRGPLTVGRSAQGRPVVVQAGSSGPGIALAAAHAEAVFTAQRTLAEGQSFYRRLKAATAEAGRNPDHVKVLPGIVPIIGGTEAEALTKERQLEELLVHEHALQQLAADVGVPADQLDLDAPLPENIRPADQIEGNRTRYELTVELARRDNLTVRQVLGRLGGGRGHRTLAGTPEQIADSMQEWFTRAAADGFNVMPAAMPSGLEDFVDHVVPILRQRGLFRTDYEGETLRDHYGLPVPPQSRRTAAFTGVAS
jgi:FMN-dependent oxidoreductase (nitrilotriacetate monooxygenase family)